MLRWKSKTTENGIEVRFATKRVTPFVLSSLTFFLAGVGVVYLISQLSLQSIGRAIVSLLLVVPIFLLILLAVVAASFLRDSLQQKSYSFSPNGIFVRTGYFWIPTGSQFLLKDEICGFGLGHFPHSRTQTLKFFANGEYFNMAQNVSEIEVSRFLEWLAENGLSYSAESNPVLRRNSGNTLFKYSRT